MDRLARRQAFAVSAENPIQRFENLRRTSFWNAPQSAHQHRHIHRRLQTMASHIANHHQQAAVTFRLNMEEVAAPTSVAG